jgi:hypothetical protein
VRRGRESGAAAVEMAIILPFLLALLIGITDVAWLLWKRVELQEAVQEGAIVFAYSPGDEATAISRARRATNVAIESSDFTPYRPFCGSSADDTYTIGLRHPLRLPITGRDVLVDVTVHGDVLVDGGCP